MTSRLAWELNPIWKSRGWGNGRPAVVCKGWKSRENVDGQEIWSNGAADNQNHVVTGGLDDLLPFERISSDLTRGTAGRQLLSTGNVELKGSHFRDVIGSALMSSSWLGATLRGSVV